MLMVFFN